MSEPDPENDPGQTPFFALLRYVLGFMGLIAFAAFASIWLLRHC